ncbi:MAG TPA: DUF4097 family beta strand repeat-containing protein [Thermoanaerobaculia bacterium]|jgi:DUF4097 and DUF4098 domain-containing protein YvlB|nr:DUF4097 family beta strand repeat-containing protein [Thermoanaerobaculia bacterium]
MHAPKLRWILLLLLGLLLVAATAEAATLKEPFNRTVPLRAGAEVRLSNVNGAVTVESWDRTEVKIEAEKKVKAGSAERAREIMEKVRIEIVQDAGGVRIETKIPKQGNGFFDWIFGNEASVGVTYRLHVPRRAALDLVSVNGGLTVTGTRGKARLETTNGGIDVADVEGELELGTVNGGIDVRRSAGALRATTTNGSIEAELTDLPDTSDLTFETTNGHVSLRLPREARLSIDAATTNGRVHSEFAVEGGQPGKHRLRGDINGGGGKLYIRTTNGGVDITEI